jgi:hypothetical protein
MANLLRKLIENTVYAGMKPGDAPRDSLYLSNRTPAQKAARAAWIVLPCLVVAGLFGWIVSGRRPAERAQTAPTAGEISARLTPGLKDLKVDSASSSLQVRDVRINRDSGVKIEGTVYNSTARTIRKARVIIELADVLGSHLGAVSTDIEEVPASGSARFSFPITQENARVALVREVVVP